MPCPVSVVARCLQSLVAFAVLASCGAKTGNPSDTDSGTDGDGEPDQWDELMDPVAGERLRPLFRVGEDGSRFHVAWYDTLLDGKCEFRQANDEVFRCVPSEQLLSIDLYADPDCTQPAVLDWKLPLDSQLVMVPDTCLSADYYEVGNPVQTVYRKMNGCEMLPSASASHRLLPTDSEAFVAADLLPADGTSRIVPLVLEAEDGARQIFGAWDREHEQEVIPVDMGDGGQRWAGRWEPSTGLNLFIDPECTDPVVVGGCIPTRVQPKTAVEVGTGGNAECPVVAGRHALLDEAEPLMEGASSGPSVYGNRTGECKPVDVSAYSRIWRRGDALAEDAFALAPSTEQGGSLLFQEVHANPEGSPVLPSGIIRDRRMPETRCDWEEMPQPSTVLRCLPATAAFLLNNYLDASCTQRTASQAVNPFDECSAEIPKYAHAFDVAAKIIEAIEMKGSYQWEGRSCVPSPATTGGTGGGGTGGGYEYDYYLVGERFPATPPTAMDVVE